MSVCYRTTPKNYDCEIALQIPMDLVEDLQARADAMNKTLDSLILELLAFSCERAHRQISNQHDRNIYALEQQDLEALTGFNERQLKIVTQKLRENEPIEVLPPRNAKNLEAMSNLCRSLKP